MKKLKSLLADDRFTGTLLVLVVGVSSFLLGQASVERSAKAAAPARVVISPQSVLNVDSYVSGTSSKNLNEVVVASRSGTKYHRPDCPGAAQIKFENKVEFTDVAAARAAGYTPASNCPGLE